MRSPLNRGAGAHGLAPVWLYDEANLFRVSERMAALEALGRGWRLPLATDPRPWSCAAARGHCAVSSSCDETGMAAGC